RAPDLGTPPPLHPGAAGQRARPGRRDGRFPRPARRASLARRARDGLPLRRPVPAGVRGLPPRGACPGTRCPRAPGSLPLPLGGATNPMSDVRTQAWFRNALEAVPDYPEFLTVDELDASTRALAEAHPDLVQVRVIGR